MTKEQKLNYIMVELDYKKAIWKLAIPSILTFTALSFYVAVDRILISRFVGPDGLASLQYVIPMLIIVSGISSVIATGTKSRFSILLGKKQYDKANHVIINGLILMILAGIFSQFAVYHLGNIAPKLFGASENMAKMASYYFKYLSYGMLVQALLMFYETLFKAKGYVKFIMFVTIVSQLVNLSLDVYLMKYLNYGIKGAAIATLISIYFQAILFALYILLKEKSFLINPFKYSFFKDSYNKIIIKLGAPEVVSSISFGLRITILTYFISRFGTKADLIVFAATRTLIPVLFIPSMGFFAASAPIIGYNFGAKNQERIVNVIKYKRKMLNIYLVSVAVLVWLFPTQILSIFHAQNYLNSKFILIVLISFVWFRLYPLIWSTVYQSTENPKQVIKQTFIRNVVIFIPIVFIFSIVTKNIRWIIISTVIADAISSLYIHLQNQKIFRKNPKLKFLIKKRKKIKDVS